MSPNWCSEKERKHFCFFSQLLLWGGKSHHGAYIFLIHRHYPLHNSPLPLSSVLSKLILDTSHPPVRPSLSYNNYHTGIVKINRWSQPTATFQTAAYAASKGSITLTEGAICSLLLTWAHRRPWLAHSHCDWQVGESMLSLTPREHSWFCVHFSSLTPPTMDQTSCGDVFWAKSGRPIMAFI